MRTPVSHHGQGHSHHSGSFLNAGILLSSVVLSCLLAQGIMDWLYQSKASDWYGVAGAVVILAGFALIFSKSIYRILDTPYFAIGTFLGIALGTALGTFVSQNAPAELFDNRYGELGSTLLRWLQLDDVFHSWWYVGLFVLLAGALVKSSLRRKFTRANLGFHLAHLSPILILAGFWIDYFYGFRGIIRLEKGQATDIAQLYRGNTNYLADSIKLGFQIRLDNFESEKYEPDYRIQVWRMPGGSVPSSMPVGQGAPHSAPEIVASKPLLEHKDYRIFGTDIHFRLEEFYPDFQFDYTYPENADTIEVRDPGVLLNLKTPLGEGMVTLRSNQQGANIIADPNFIGGWLEFHWDIPKEVEQLQNHQTPDPKWLEVDRIILVGLQRMIYFLESGVLTSRSLENQQFYPFFKGEDSGFTLIRLFPDGAYLKAVPVSKSDELLNPVARVSVWKKEGSLSEEVYLYPSVGGGGGIFMIPESEFFLALESFKDRETRYWKSGLSVLGPGGEVQKNQAIQVNQPMLYKGYRFYQTDYDPNNPNYSGIGISHEPGLYILYLGFVVLVVGCAMMFYGKVRS